MKKQDHLLIVDGCGDSLLVAYDASTKYGGTALLTFSNLNRRVTVAIEEPEDLQSLRNLHTFLSKALMEISAVMYAGANEKMAESVDRQDQHVLPGVILKKGDFDA